jgi:hypothetical protein
LAFLTQNKAKLCKILIIFEKNANFFRRKLSKIAENCDHNIDPWSDAAVPKCFFRREEGALRKSHLPLPGHHDPHLGSDFDASAQSCSGVSASAAANLDPHSGGSLDDGLLQLEPPLTTADYNFTLDDQENLNDLFENFPF